jgi:hypothetical protein
MYEKGPEERARIMFWEQPGYGVRQPKSVQRADGGGHFEFTIRGVPERRIEMETFTLGSSCRARAYIEIDGQRAVFSKIAIVVSGWANVHRVEIFGSRVSDGSSVSEITHQDE